MIAIVTWKGNFIKMVLHGRNEYIIFGVSSSLQNIPSQNRANYFPFYLINLFKINKLDDIIKQNVKITTIDSIIITFCTLWPINYRISIYVQCTPERCYYYTVSRYDCTTMPNIYLVVEVSDSHGIRKWYAHKKRTLFSFEYNGSVFICNQLFMRYDLADMR